MWSRSGSLNPLMKNPASFEKRVFVVKNGSRREFNCQLPKTFDYVTPVLDSPLCMNKWVHRFKVVYLVRFFESDIFIKKILTLRKMLEITQKCCGVFPGA